MEEQEAAREDLKSAHEEVLSANEEFQSTNEELETAKNSAIEVFPRIFATAAQVAGTFAGDSRCGGMSTRNYR